ncbi:hypothetical protein QTO34_001619 [Cnephaeus nilssonii]|uniref:PPIase cyclophilin-type domain-containing protein n=1 Tax=Cnephaeus nilssonii TaxID=3371016 RepID=A0AA40HX67_CNENI|nr:hypothetical protein QTO34_001619 [Eptesicus nilssonii]
MSTGRFVGEAPELCPHRPVHLPATAGKRCERGQETNSEATVLWVVPFPELSEFMVQSGDFSEGTESFVVKYNKEFLWSTANRGKGTNGSQFFITRKPTPHGVFSGHMVTSEDIGRETANQKTMQPANQVLRHGHCCVERFPNPKLRKEKRKGINPSPLIRDSDSSWFTVFFQFF